jgi:hypothetical protein
MANPLSLFRKYQYALLVVFGVVLMIAFVIAPPILDYQRVRSQGQLNAVVVNWKGGELRENDIRGMVLSRNMAGLFLDNLYQRTVAKRGEPRVPRLIESASEESVLRSTLLAEQAEKAGMRASDEAVIDYLEQFTAELLSRAEIGQVFQQSLGGRMSEPQLFNILRTELLAQNYLIMTHPSLFLSRGESVTPYTAWQYHERLRKRVKAEVVALEVAKFKSRVQAEPTEAQIQALYDEAKERYPDPSRPEPGFKVPRKIEFHYVRGDYNAFEAQQLDAARKSVTDDEIKQHYETNKQRYPVVPEVPDAKPEGAAMPPVTPPASEAKPAEPAAPPTAEAAPASPEKSAPAAATPAPVPAPAAPAPELTPPAPPPSEGSSMPPTPAPPAAESAAPKSEPQSAVPMSPSDGLYFTNLVAESAAPAAESSPPAGGAAPTAPAESTAPAGANPSAADTAQPAAPAPAEEKPAAPAAAPTAAAAPAEAAPAAEAKPAAPSETAAAAPAAKPDEPAPPAKPEPQIRPLDDKLMAEIREELALSKARKAAQERLDKVLSEVKREVEVYARGLRDSEGSPPKPLDIKQFASERGLTTGEIPLADGWQIQEYELGKSFDMVGYSFQQQPFVAIAYQEGVPLYRPAQILGESRDVYFVYWKVREQEPFVPKLEEIRAQVIDAWKLREAMKVARADADQLVAKTKAAGKSLKEALAGLPDITVKETNEFSWLSTGFTPAGMGMPGLSFVENVDDVGPEFMQSVFALKVGETGVAINEPQNKVYVVRIMSETPTEDELKKQFLESGRSFEIQQVAFMESQRFFRDWYQGLESQLGVKWQRSPLAQETGR